MKLKDLIIYPADEFTFLGSLTLFPFFNLFCWIFIGFLLCLLPFVYPFILLSEWWEENSYKYPQNIFNKIKQGGNYIYHLFMK
jgi:hypothetical protein